MRKKVIILCSLDGFANSMKPMEIKKFLEDKNIDVELFNTLYISRFRIGSLQSKVLPAPGMFKFSLYMVELASVVLNSFFAKYKSAYTYYSLLAQMKLRRKILLKELSKRKFDLLICESQIDSYIFNSKLQFNSMYDCATPWSDELYFGNDLTDSQFRKFKRLEIRIFQNARYLSFHWDQYADYIRKYYKYTMKNVITFNGGTEKKSKLTTYNKNPKIVYLGFLGGKWINLPLLSKLSKIYKIDVYGSPMPDKKYKLNYIGYAKPDILSEYQFGLITITKDPLRSEGFSAKHLEYLSYGLPVLVPVWRKNVRKIKGSIPYDENNFIDTVIKYSEKSEWTKMHEDALDQAEKLRWDNSLSVLVDKIIK